MASDQPEAREVILALRHFRDRIEQLMARLEDKKHLTLPEKEDIQGLLKTLKEDLKKAAKNGSVDGSKGPLNQFELAYYEPAVSEASANLRVAVNTDPLRAKWYSSLYGVHMDITHLLSQLEAQFPNV